MGKEDERHGEEVVVTAHHLSDYDLGAFIAQRGGAKLGKGWGETWRRETIMRRCRVRR